MILADDLAITSGYITDSWFWPRNFDWTVVAWGWNTSVCIDGSNNDELFPYIMKSYDDDYKTYVNVRAMYNIYRVWQWYCYIYAGIRILQEIILLCNDTHNVNYLVKMIWITGVINCQSNKIISIIRQML